MDAPTSALSPRATAASAASTESKASALGSPRRSSQNTGGAATTAMKIDNMNGTSNGAAARTPATITTKAAALISTDAALRAAV